MSASLDCTLKDKYIPKVSPSSSTPKTSVIETTNPGKELVKCADSFHEYSGKSSCNGGSLIAEIIVNSGFEPKVGMTFESEDEAYNFYNTYAKKKGFSVRKDHISRRSDGRIRYRHYVCSNEGTRKEQAVHISRRSRPIERTNCLARIEFKVNNENIWVVNKFVDEHNHPLANPNSSHMLRSHKKKLPAQGKDFTKSSFYFRDKAAQMNDFSEEAHFVEDAELLFKNQCCCLSNKRMRDLENGDAQLLLDFMKAKQLEDPSFFYAIQLDDNDRLTSCFWTDMQSVVDYAYFGDAVSLDTTYHMYSSDLPFALFIGVNHHKEVVVFGAAILLDESVESFVWLFRTFLAAMSGKQPKTVVTDKCAAISEAISMVLPNTSHRFCLWHLYQSALAHPPCSDINFCEEFEKCIYGVGSGDDFHEVWNNLISQFGLASNQWLKDLYAVREKWAAVYHNSPFYAILMTKQWAEKMENLFKFYFVRKLPLSKFIMQYLKALIQLREKEILEDYESTQTKPVLFVEVPMLTEAAASYTRTIYVDFEHEYKGQLACLCEHVGMNQTVCTFRVSNPKKQCHGVVEFDPSKATVTCSCRKFESMGILCMHALKVLNNNNVLCLPSHYILKRWTKYAKDGLAFSSGAQASLTLRYRHVCRKAIALSLKSAVSKDALDILEHALNKFIAKMENALHNDSKQPGVHIVDSFQETTLNK